MPGRFFPFFSPPQAAFFPCRYDPRWPPGQKSSVPSGEKPGGTLYDYTCGCVLVYFYDAVGSVAGLAVHDLVELGREVGQAHGA